MHDGHIHVSRGDFSPRRRDLARKCSRLLAMEGNDVARLIRNSCAGAITVDEVHGVQQAGGREPSAADAYMHTRTCTCTDLPCVWRLLLSDRRLPVAINRSTYPPVYLGGVTHSLLTTQAVVELDKVDEATFAKAEGMLRSKAGAAKAAGATGGAPG